MQLVLFPYFFVIIPENASQNKTTSYIFTNFAFDFVKKNTSHREKCFFMRPVGRFFIALNKEGGSDVFHRRQKAGI